MNYTPIQFLMNGIKDSDGQPLEAGKVYTYDAGTTTLSNTLYLTYNGLDDDGVTSTLSSNPFNLDSLGSKLIYATPNKAYKFLIHDKDDVLMHTFDYISFPEVTY